MFTTELVLHKCCKPNLATSQSQLLSGLLSGNEALLATLTLTLTVMVAVPLWTGKPSSLAWITNVYLKQQLHQV